MFKIKHKYVVFWAHVIDAGIWFASGFMVGYFYYKYFIDKVS